MGTWGLLSSYLFRNHQTPAGMSSSNSDPSLAASQQFEVVNAPNINEPEITEAAPEELPTDSHALANVDHDEKGAAQIDHGHAEVKDLGWNDHPSDVPAPLVGGLPNEELWTLIRRFNKQMYHVKALPEPPLGGLDLNIADEEEFSPDKLRANIERLYLTAGVLGSDNSLTGAPEKHQGEAVEQEASNFVNGFTSIAISSATGKHPGGDQSDDATPSSLESRAPDPTHFAIGAADAKDKAAGGEPNAVHDKTKEPMSAAMWSKARPVMHAIADVSDGWERVGNALSPTAPFPKEKPRMKLAAVLVPILLISLFTNSYMFMKMNGLFAGFGFFADPIIWRAASYLNRKFPHWQKLLEIRNTLLKGVPTNARLTVTLLRIGEVNKAPLPPPPYSGPPPPNAAHETAGQNLEHLGVPNEEIADAVHPDAAVTTGTDVAPKKKQHGRRILAAIKGVAKGGVETALGTDRLKAAAGGERAKNRLGVLKSGGIDRAGPVDFPCRFKGKKGHAYITSTATTPALSWTTEKEDVDPVFSIAISDIQEIKKVGGLGWKTRLVVGWATSRDIADGILIIDKQGSKKQLTAMELREELFNRLITMGNQMWEAW